MGRSTELLRAPIDDLIADHRARVEYESKQKDERIPRQYASIGGKIPTGGCASIAGEFYYGGAFRYGRDPRKCKAEETIEKKNELAGTSDKGGAGVGHAVRGVREAFGDP